MGRAGSGRRPAAGSAGATAGSPCAASGRRRADYTAELEKLAKLRDDGVITADDFEAKKKQLLGI